MNGTGSSASSGGGLISYIAIAKGSTFLCTYPPDNRKDNQTAALLLDRIDPIKEVKQTFLYHSQQIHYIHTTNPKLKGGLTFIAVANEPLGRKIPFSCLETLKTSFWERYNVTEIKSAGFLEFTSFNDTLKSTIESASVLANGGSQPGAKEGIAGHGAGSDKAREVQRELDAVKAILHQNIEVAMRRGDVVGELVDKSARLNESAVVFRKKSREVKQQMWWQSIKTTALIGLVALILLYLLIGVGCGLPLWERCF